MSSRRRFSALAKLGARKQNVTVIGWSSVASQRRRFVGLMAFADAWSGAIQPSTQSIPDLVRGLEAVVAAVISPGGALKDANRGFLRLMTRCSSSPEIADIRGLFITPRFDDFVTLHRDPFEGTIYRGLISFGKPGAGVTSLRGAVYEHDGEYIVIAEHDVIGLESLRSTLLELQDDLTVKQQRIVHLEQRLARLQELADAALRDRDTLLDALAHRGVPKPE
jgi:hypothetical protein